MPGAQATNKDTALSVSGLSVSDVDANGGTETTTLSVTEGTITLASTTGLTFSKGTGTADTTETFTGTLSAIDNAIATLTYRPTTGYVGSDTLTFATNDNGNTGTGGAKTTTQTVGITVNNVNPTDQGTIANQRDTDGQSGVAIATSQAFADSLGLTLTYGATGLPTGLAINATTGAITGTIDHDASKNAPTTTGSGATLDGTYTVVETASDGQGGSTTQTFTIDSTNQAPVVGTKTANQTNSDGDTITAVNVASAFSDPNGDPLTYAATGLPAGLTISSAGAITGTVAKNAAPGTDAVIVTATDDKGAATTETFNWVVKDVPPTGKSTLANQAYTDGQAAISIATAQGFTDSNGNALTYSAAGLPTGLAIDTATGVITGTIDHDASKNAPVTTGSGATLDGKYTVTVTASDGLGGTAAQTFTTDSTNQAPAVGTKTASQSNTDGATITAVNAASAFSDSNGDPLTYTASGLPAGLAISAGGVISGTVAVNAQPGTDAVTVTATDDKGAATSETFNWIIKDVPPTTSGTLANHAYSDGQSGVSIATAPGFADSNGNALTYSASGLPAGLTINASTGMITGTLGHDDSKDAPATSGSGATLDGTYAVVVTASDGLGGTATQGFTIDATNQAPVVGTPTANQANGDGDTIAALNAANAFTDPNGDPLTYAASGLPAGLAISSAGVVTGTVAGNAKPGTDTVIVTATDDKGATTSETFSWVIKDVPPATNGTLANQAFTDGQAGVSIATAQGFAASNGNALTYADTGLPTGLTLNATTGAITGTLDHDASKNAPAMSGSGATLDGRYTVVETASDGLGGSATQSFTIDSTNRAPIVGTKTPNQGNSDGDTVTAVNAASAFSDPNGDPLTYAAAGLPAGLAISSAGVISGTIAKNAAPGTDTVSVTATDDKGAATTETFGWVVKDVPPTTSGTLANQAYVDSQSGVSIATAQGFTPSNGNALTYKAAGLPAGLTINAATGVITGTIDHDASKNAPATSGSGATLDGKYGVTVTASDGLGGTAAQTFTIDSTNQAPNVGTATANQASKDGQTIAAIVTAGVFTDPNTGDVLTYGASDLPAGLTINPTTGVISGTVAANAAPGSYAVRVLATDDKGAASREAFTWVIQDVPPTTSGTLANQRFADSASGISIATAGAFTSPNGLALTYRATGLPAGLSIDPGTGAITGRLDHDASKNAPVTSGSGATLDGTYAIVVTASDGQGGSAQTSFAIDSTNTAPVVGTVTADQHAPDGARASVDASAAFSDPNTGDTLTYGASGLPAGLGINAATGLISGTIDKAASLNGPTTVTVTATDDKGAATSETFHWSVADVPPTATPPLPDLAVYDGASLGTPTANGFTNPNGLPLTYSASGLPSGLAIDATTGLISGTLDHNASVLATGGVYTIAVTADDGQGGSATNTFHLTATNQAPVVGTPTAGQTSSDGQTVATLDASRAFADPNGDPLTYAASGLPSGLSIDPATGRITGTVAANAKPGAYAATVVATDDKGAATPETFTWTITDTPPATSGTIADMAAPDGEAGIAIATASAFANPDGLPLTYTVTGLPAGLAINSQTGQITGTLDHDASANAPVERGVGSTLEGTYTITVTAADGRGGTAAQTFTFDATNGAPVVGTVTADQTGTAGNTASLGVAAAFSDPNAGDVLTYTASGLPAGLTIDAGSGMISGTIATNADSPTPYAVTVTATDDKGAATSEHFDWTIDPAPPSAAAPIPNVAASDGSAVSIATSSHFSNPDGGPLVFTASGLPSTLAIDATTGVISGTLDHDASEHGVRTSGSGATLEGTYTVAVTATGAGVPVTQTFTIDTSNQAPVVAARTVDQVGTTGQTIATLDASQAFADPNGDPLTYAATGLPAGLTIDGGTGRITGTIAATASGAYAVTVTATDDKGAATREAFAFTVADAAPQATGTIAARTYADSTRGISVATAAAFTSPDGLSLTYAATGLPQGLTIDATTGVISGTLDHDASRHGLSESGAGATLDGTYAVVVTATDGQGGTVTQAFTIDATNDAPVVGTATSNQHSFDGNAASLDTSAAFGDPNTGDVLTYAASGLPTGLAINAATGLISGTIDKGASGNGPYAVTVTATDDKGAATSETFAWTVDDIVLVATPPLPDRATADGSTVALTTANGFTNPNDLPLTYAALGLPSRLAIDATTGVIAGTLDHDASILIANGVYTIAVTASDGQGGSATNTFHLTATNQAPLVGVPTTAQTAKDGQTVTPVDTARAFTDPNGDPLTFTASNLPAGLSIDPRTGLVTGTVANTVASGTTTVTVSATDDKGAAALETFTWSIDDVPPSVVGSLAGQRFADGTNTISIATAGGFASPNGLPLTYAASGLPKGLTIDPSTGLVSGFINHDASKNAPVTSGSGATLDGAYQVTITADDGQGGLAHQLLTIDTTNQAPALGGRTADQSGVDGATVALPAGNAFADPNLGDVLTFAASGLPKGLTINAATGAITGTIDRSASVAGPYAVTVTATDDKGAATSETFAFAVTDAPPVATKAIAPIILEDGSAASIATAAGFASPNGLPLAFSASGLPAGLSIDPATGSVSGAIDHDASKNAPVTAGAGATLDGTYAVVVTVSDDQGGSASQSFTIDARNTAPAIVTATADQRSVDGASVNLAIAPAFTDPNGDGLTFTASGLPKGLTINAATGAITGTIDASASGSSPYAVTVTATDDKGAATSETFAFAVAESPPVAGPPVVLVPIPDGTTIAPFDTAGDFSSPNGLPLTYAATGLPAGLAIDPATGVITGALDHDASANAPVVSGTGAAQSGTYTVIVTASDGQGGTASQTFLLGTSNQAPILAPPTADQHSMDGATASLAVAQAFIDPNGDPLTFTTTGLPPGLAIDPATGAITGTIDLRASAAGPYSVTVTATDDKGASASEAFAWVVADDPPVASSPGTAIALGIVPDGTNIPPFDTAPAFADPNGLPLTYGATGLPAGLAINPETGVVTGTVDHDASTSAPFISGTGVTQEGLYTVIVTASDGQGGAASQGFTIGTSNQAPVVGTRTPDQRSSDGDMVSIDAAQAFSDPNGDSLTFTAAGLPRGLAIDPASGAITGTIDPRASVYGPFAVTVTATDDKGASASETFVWRVADAPVIAGAPVPSLEAPDGSPIAPIDAAAHFSDPDGLPLTYSATGLPVGLSIDPANGAITGMLDHDASLNAPVTSGSGATLQGTYQVAVTASDGQGGLATQTFAIVADNRAPAQVGIIADQTGRAGQTIAPLAVAPDFADPDGDPLVFRAAGLPPGLTLDSNTGTVSGTIAPTVTRPTDFPVTIVATDDKGASASVNFVFRVTPTLAASQPPVLPLASLATADAFIPLATVLGDTLLDDVIVADHAAPAISAPDTPGPEVIAATPVLDVINLTSGDQEQSVVIRADDIVMATVNNVRPLDGLQDLTTPGAGIIRSGAATNERGDRFERTGATFANTLQATDAPIDTLGAALADAGVSTIGDGTAINVETVLRDRVLTVTLDNRSAIACVVPVAGYTVTRANGSPLPPWLRLEDKGVVIGKVPGGVEAIDLRITSTLRNGIVHERTVTIRTDTGAIRAQPAQGPLHRAGRSLSDMVAAARQVPGIGQVPATGRGLSRYLD